MWELLQQGAYVYICGSQAVRDDVRKAFVSVAATAGGLSQEDAEAYLTQLETVEGRYRPDIWG